MDSIDLTLLNLLQSNGRASHETLAQKVNLSRPAVRQRIIKLEESGAIKRYKAIIDYSKLGYNLNVLIYVKLRGMLFHEFVKSVKEIKQEGIYVDSYYRLAGEWCVLLKVISDTPKNITFYIDRILSIKGVAGTTTTFILDTIDIE